MVLSGSPGETFNYSLGTFCKIGYCVLTFPNEFHCLFLTRPRSFARISMQRRFFFALQCTGRFSSSATSYTACSVFDINTIAAHREIILTFYKLQCINVGIVHQIADKQIVFQITENL